jgi:hypothetical protein
MNKKLSIIYITCRRQPMFQWFVETLLSQYENNIVTDQIIFIDSFIDYQEDRKEKLKQIIDGRFEYIHISPKPSIWRGKHRKTKTNFFDASATRNTGLIVSENEHIVFIDDLSALTNEWINFHRKAAEDKIILCGAYDKVSNIIVKNNKIENYSRKDCDGRALHQPTQEKIKAGGGWVFGQNVSFPFEFLEKINGYDEFFARRGAEDCNLGVRLELAGYKDLIYYDKNCLIIEDELMHFTGENEVDEYYPKRVWKSDIEKNNKVNALMSKLMNDIEYKNLYIDKNFKTIDTNFNLIKERLLYSQNNSFKSVTDINYIDFDGEPIEEI